MFEFFRRLFVRKEEPKKEEEKSDKLQCKVCKGDKWYEGASGGISINIECVNCHKEYNYTGGIFEITELPDSPQHKQYLRDNVIGEILK